MSDIPNPGAAKKRQALRARIFWFIAGAAVNYELISTPFEWLKTHTALPNGIIAPCSVTVAATLFFFWNYFVNFRTEARKREALRRYIGAVMCMTVLSSVLLTALKNHNWHYSFNVGRFPLDLDVVATQFFLAWLKFFLYHKWVFPVTAKPAEPPDGGVAGLTGRASQPSAGSAITSRAPL